MATEKHNYTKPELKAIDWGVSLNEFIEQVDDDMPIVDTDANTSGYTPTTNQLYVAYDTQDVYRGDGANWLKIGTIAGGTSGGGTAMEQELANGNIVLIGEDFYEVFDPASQADALGYAISRIRSQSTSTDGHIHLPPRKVIECPGGPYTDLQDITLHSDMGNPTTLEFTNLAADAFEIQGISGRRFNIKGHIVIDGSDRINRTAGSAFHFTGSAPFVDFDNVNVRNWIHPVIHMDTGHPFESQWNRVYGAQYTGDLFLIESGGETTEIRQIVYGGLDQSPAITANFPGGSYNIGQILSRKDQQQGAAAVLNTAINGSFVIDHIQFETAWTGTVDRIVTLSGNGATHINNIRVTSVDGSVDHVASLRSNHGNQYIGNISVDAGVTLNQNLIEITHDNFRSSEIKVEKDEIDNNSGLARLSHPIHTNQGDYIGGDYYVEEYEMSIGGTVDSTPELDVGFGLQFMELRNGETIEVMEASLLTVSGTTVDAAPTDLNLKLYQTTGGAVSLAADVLLGNGNLKVNESNANGTPIASWTNNTGSTVIVLLGVHNFTPSAQSVVANAVVRRVA